MNYFTTYAQNLEDVLLWRALRHVEHGFYIDVGANDPEHHSVTRAFYERGWHGINIEPLPHFARRFHEQRVHDINLTLAAGAEDGEIVLYDTPDVDGWASSDAAVAEQHRAEGYQVVELRVPVRRLAGICEQYVTGEIHFLKVDVEGFETEVLQGMDFARWQPWIVVVEATLPGKQTTNHEKWEHLLTSHGYRYCYFDGLNRYYVAPAHPELADALQVQPNVFDEYHSVHLVRAWAEMENLGRRVAALGGEKHDAEARAQQAYARMEQAVAHADRVAQQLDAAQQRAVHAESHVQGLHDRARELELALIEKTAVAAALDARIQGIYGSLSWILTKPLRLAGRVVRFLIGSNASAAPAAQASVPAAEPEAPTAVPPPAAADAAPDTLPAPARDVLRKLHDAS